MVYSTVFLKFKCSVPSFISRFWFIFILVYLYFTYKNKSSRIYREIFIGRENVYNNALGWSFLTGVFSEKRGSQRWEKEYAGEKWTYVTALVPSETACLASSPGNKSRTAVWISRDEIVWRLLYWANREASAAIRSTITNRNHWSVLERNDIWITYQKYHWQNYS